MELPVHFGGRLVATIDADQDHTRLSYTQAWRDAPDRFPISLTMPVGEGPYEADTVLPWLMNLLPEGEPLRAMTRALGASREDVLGLIAETGSDLAGALSIAPPEHQRPPAYHPIPDEAALERIIAELPARPFLVGDEGVSMSLAGAQDKLPIALLNGTICIPVNGAASTHILKPDNPRLPDSVQNEALCMTLARRIGLNVAPVTTGMAGERTYLLVERYDRVRDGDQVRRIHQEDFCQALGRPPAAKYQFNRTGPRGPSLADMFALVRQHMTARDITRLLDAVILNVAIGNVDSHAKNYSVLLQSGGPVLAPLYDLMSGLAWEGITPNHAQDIGGQRRGLYVYGRHWRRMADASHLAGRGTVQRVEQITSRLLRELPQVGVEVSGMPGGPGNMLQIFERSIMERATEVGTHATQNGTAEQPIDMSETEASTSDPTATAYPNR